MHEQSITEGILSIALEQAKIAKANRITGISLTIGNLTGIVDESVKFYFDFLSKDTIAAGATLSFEHPKTTLRCRSCDIKFSPEDLVWSCPGCHEQKVEIVSGKECYVNSIEVDESGS